MKIGLIDVDGHNFPNLALMRISSYHKSRGDEVEWYQPPLFGAWYDIVYMSKVFSDSYSPDVSEPLNAGRIIKGGTGYAIHLDNGKEVFDTNTHTDLPPEMERMFPDYSIYPQYPFAVAMTSRGCSRGCPFCHVHAKEGSTHKVADVSDFWNGQDEIKVLDPNITACKEKRNLMRQYKETGAWIDFTQGIDIRLINDEDIEDLNEMKIKNLHFAWDNPNDDLRKYFLKFNEKYKRKNHRLKMVYCLTNYEDIGTDEHVRRALERIYWLRDNGFDPFLMIYDKPNAPKELIRMQFWCNSKILFNSCKRFEDFSYDRRREIQKEKMKQE